MTMEPKAGIAIGGFLVATPIWSEIFSFVHSAATLIAVVCGAVVGLHSVWLIWKKHKK